MGKQTSSVPKRSSNSTRNVLPGTHLHKTWATTIKLQKSDPKDCIFYYFALQITKFTKKSSNLIFRKISWVFVQLEKLGFCTARKTSQETFPLPYNVAKIPFLSSSSDSSLKMHSILTCSMCVKKEK